MRYLARAYQLADERGYLRDPEVLLVVEQLPDWFRRLGDPTGVTEFETQHGVQMPEALREFYGCILLACFLEVAIDVEVFLRSLDDPDPPPLIDWVSGRHLVFAFHNHSGMVCAAALGRDDPLVNWGWEDEEPLDQPSLAFSDWVYGAVDGHERKLDYWQNVYEKCRADPAEARRLGSVEWIRYLPGIARRLGG